MASKKIPRRRCRECGAPFGRGSDYYSDWCGPCRDKASEIELREREQVRLEVARFDAFSERVKREAGLL